MRATAKATVKAKAAGGKDSALLGKLKPLKLRAKPTNARAGKLAKVTLKAKAASSEKLLKALGEGTIATAKVKVRLTDASGNVVTLKKSIELLAG